MIRHINNKQMIFFLNVKEALLLFYALQNNFYYFKILNLHQYKIQTVKYSYELYSARPNQ